MDKKIITRGSGETEILGSEFSKKLKVGDVILLFGELGAGKTTFVKGVAEGLGITERIASPTFVLLRSHRVNRNNIKNLNHVDLYRIEKPQELESLGLPEIIEQEGSVTIIEWADRLLDFNLKKSLSSGGQVYRIYFKHLNRGQREITIESYG
ncbi:MAG: tRNA (adenosine(37)-N6)-threonylcarbamoyltransferase complex ATPase subunit type 1 TsaE [Candidatus Levybacteria bacterium]|nr:tRNA (adenosine(37)-N6)-threonylcarbamoyltransferase complex ATPase subunit type 1 TsaE [Candidatus Levybacteria bacterium]